MLRLLRALEKNWRAPKRCEHVMRKRTWSRSGLESSSGRPLEPLCCGRTLLGGEAEEEEVTRRSSLAQASLGRLPESMPQESDDVLRCKDDLSLRVNTT